jgi:hypothetical protein
LVTDDHGHCFVVIHCVTFRNETARTADGVCAEGGRRIFDELLAEIDAIRQGPRLGWIRDALSSKLTMAQAQARVDEEQVRIAAEKNRARAEADARNNAAALAALERGEASRRGRVCPPLPR